MPLCVSTRLVVGLLAVLALQASAQLATLPPPSNQTLPPFLNQTNVTAPSSPSFNRTNATAPLNKTNATAPLPSPPLNQTNATAPLPSPPLNQTNATAPLPSRPLNRSNVSTLPIPQNQTLRPGGHVVIRNQTVPVVVFNQTSATDRSGGAVPIAITGATAGSGIITPLAAQQQTTAPGQQQQQQTQTGLNANDVVAIAGWNGTIEDGGETLILKLPRSQLIDLRVKGVFVPGAGSKASFRPMSDGNVNFMVELLLLDDEVDDVLRAGLGAGLHVMALHTHLLFDQPKAYFMHLHGVGISPRTAAGTLRNLTNTIVGVRAAPPAPAAAPVTTLPSTVALAPLQSALSRGGLRAQQNPDDGTVQVLAPPLTASVMGYNASHSMGCQSEATIAGTDADAIVYGQFCSTQYNLQRVLVGTLRQELSVTAIVNHFVGDVPQTIFVHFWGRGPAQNLANAVVQAFPESYRSP